MKQSLVLDFMTTDLNTFLNAIKNPRWGTAKASEIKREETYRVSYSCKEQNIKRFKGKVHIHFNWYFSRRLDPDNVRFGAKSILDGLVKAKVIQTDSMKHISGLSDTFIRDKEDQVIVDITSKK